MERYYFRNSTGISFGASFVHYLHNDMPDTTRSLCRLFADDSKMYLCVKLRTDQEIIQADLFKLCDWSNK